MRFAFTMTPGVRIRAAQFGPAVAVTALQRLTLEQKELRARELHQAIADLLNLHRQPFAPATPPQATPPPPVDRAAVVADHRRRALLGIGVFEFDARRRAKASAKAFAQQHIAYLEAERLRLWQQAQAELDGRWAALLRNDPPAVHAALTEAFRDNEAPAVATGLDGAEVSLVALVPDLEAMPERTPDTTGAGNLTLRKLTRTERAELHAAAVTSHVLRTVREALAVAPGLTAARIVALQRTGSDAYGRATVEALLAARFERRQLDGVRWDQASAAVVLNGASSEVLVNRRSTTGELRPLDVRREPDLAAVLQHIRVDATPAGGPPVPPLTAAGLAAGPAAGLAPGLAAGPAAGQAVGPAWAAGMVGATPAVGPVWSAEADQTGVTLATARPSTTPDNTMAVRVAIAVAWLLLLIIGLAVGVGTFLVLLGLPLLAIGLAALLAGRADWAWITNRQVGGATLAAGVVLVLVGAAAASPPEPAGNAGAAPATTAPATTTSRTTTTAPPPTTTAPSPTPALVPTSLPAPPPPPPPPATTPKVPPQQATTQPPQRNCHPSYPTLCLPPAPPDLDCGDVDAKDFSVLPPDPHGLDGDKDGIGCETS